MTASATENRRSIAQVNRMLRSILEAETLEQFFWVGGKIDRFYKSERGHVYFDLVDDRTRIRCMLREERTAQFPFDLHNHLEVEVCGDVQFFEERAETQINVVDLRLSDESAGILPVIDRLRAQGLYPPTKRQPPARIRRIGMITSQSSRAIGDFESAYQSASQREVLAPVNWKYVKLEGDRARQSIVDAIVALDKDPEIDVIAIIRGGGRHENFAALNTYEIARAVSECKTFIVAGIGHHKDSTLTDEVANYAASTPTAAAHYIANLCLRLKPPITRQRHYPAERSSRPSNLLAIILLAVAIASLLGLIAVMIAQAP
ncbi:MAG: exodeoxyribonuclease VII large subunit [Chloroflexota bacterium]|nr:exodeoxyribonuclease VII large subunit [Chloroflexota bacterium]